MVRKSSSLKKNTDLKVDGAYADIVAPPRKKGDPTGQSTALTNQADAISPLAQEAVDTGGMLNYQPQDIFRPAENELETGLSDTNPQQVVQTNPNTNTQILIDMIKEQSNIAKLRF